MYSPDAPRQSAGGGYDRYLKEPAAHADLADPLEQPWRPSRPQPRPGPRRHHRPARARRAADLQPRRDRRDGHGRRAPAHGGGLRARYPHRHPVAESGGVPGSLLRHHARGAGRGACQYEAAARNDRLHRRRCCHRILLHRCGEATDGPRRHTSDLFRRSGPAGVRRSLPTDRVRDADGGAGRDRPDALHLGLVGTAEGRATDPRRPALGAISPRRPAERPPFGRPAAVPHERADVVEGRLRHQCVAWC